MKNLLLNTNLTNELKQIILDLSYKFSSTTCAQKIFTNMLLDCGEMRYNALLEIKIPVVHIRYAPKYIVFEILLYDF